MSWIDMVKVFVLIGGIFTLLLTVLWVGKAIGL